ncbi:hypothetical protein JW865_09425 [Candidatus Bathyarchaeota archaeon]|nr:hypothetical protein [Candidatus Bathyarchaeota archaeon]
MAQDKTFIIEFNGKVSGTDTLIFDGRNGSWFKDFTVIDINVRNPEDATGALYLGGIMGEMSRIIGEKDFKFMGQYSDIEIAPILTDITGTVLLPSPDTTWYGVKLSIYNFPCTKPAIWYVPNTCDSVDMKIIFSK